MEEVTVLHTHVSHVSDVPRFIASNVKLLHNYFFQPVSYRAFCFHSVHSNYSGMTSMVLAKMSSNSSAPDHHLQVTRKSACVAQQVHLIEYGYHV